VEAFVIVRPTIVFVNPADELQNAIDAIPAGGGTIQLLAKSYPLAAGLTFPEDRYIVLNGVAPGPDGVGGTILNLLDEDENGITISSSGHTVSNLMVNYPGGTGTGIGIKIGKLNTVLFNNTISNVRVANSPSWGIHIGGTDTLGTGFSIQTELNRCHVRLNKANGGIYVGNACTTIFLNHCETTQTVTKGLQIAQADKVVCRDCSFEVLSGATDKMVLVTGDCRSVSFRDCWFEEWTYHNNYLLEFGAGNFMGCVVDNCIFNRGGGVQRALQAIAVNQSSGTSHAMSILNPWGFTADTTNGTSDILLGAGATGTVIVGGTIQTDGNTFTKMTIDDSGTDTLVTQPSLGTVPGRHSLPVATKAQLIANKASHKAGEIAFDSTATNPVWHDGTDWWYLGVGAKLV
jgi:hypothetical protein